MRRFVAMAGMLALTSMAFVGVRAEVPPSDPGGTSGALAPLEPFLGEWTGSAGGFGREAIMTVSYRRVLNDRFIEMRTRSESDHDIHEDIGYFSYDKARCVVVFRQFHTEGFVTRYVLTGVRDEGRTVVFDTESIENLGPGWRARLTMTRTGEDRYSFAFDLAPPEKDLSTCQAGELER